MGKVADQVSDTILDAILAQDKHSRVACETVVKSGMVLIAGGFDSTGFTLASAETTQIKLARRSALGVSFKLGHHLPSVSLDSDRTAAVF